MTAEGNCLFCDIYNGVAPATILFKDEDVVVFPDIRPAAKHHYLIVSRDHIINAKHLTKEHIPLLNKFIQLGESTLRENLADLTDSRMGFHWPPCNSISHLHLHVISPISSMSFLNKVIFPQNNLWFVSPQYLIQRLEKQ